MHILLLRSRRRWRLSASKPKSVSAYAVAIAFWSANRDLGVYVERCLLQQQHAMDRITCFPRLMLDGSIEWTLAVVLFAVDVGRVFAWYRRRG